MHIGICKITLHLPTNHSLKGKRKVIHSLSERIQHRFNVAVAEVDNNDVWQLATLGLACISPGVAHLGKTLRAPASTSLDSATV
ncbi:MAG: DUF503 domain-containing protein, partial [Gammaproteobacteria bacterium]